MTTTSPIRATPGQFNEEAAWQGLLQLGVACLLEILPGTPTTTDPSGTSVPSVTTAPAPITDPLPIRAPLRTMAPMPTSTRSPMVQPWRIAPWPTETSLPISTGWPLLVCTTQLSWMLERSPITIRSLSARTTAPNQIPTWLPSVTSPITVALPALNNGSPETFASICIIT